MGCFCAVPEEFYCEVLLLDESKLTLTTQHQGIKRPIPSRKSTAQSPHLNQPLGLGSSVSSAKNFSEEPD